jgi:hypothetical protein
MSEKKSDISKSAPEKSKGVIVKIAEPAKKVQEPVKSLIDSPAVKSIADSRKGHRSPDDWVHAPVLSIPKDLGARAHFISKFFVGALILELFVVIGGGAWALGDQISTSKWDWFIALPFQWQVVIISLIAFSAFVIFFGLVILYRRGRNAVLKALYGKIMPTDESIEFSSNQIPRIVVGITMISALVLLSGAVIAFIEISTTGGLSLDGEMALVFSYLTGGERLLLVITFIIIMTALVLGFLFLWQTGYNFIMTRLARINKKFKQVNTMLNARQQRISSIIFIAIVGTIVVMVFGLIWLILDVATPSGTPWEIFIGTNNVGLMIIFFGLFSTIVSLVLLSLMMRYYWLRSINDRALFEHKHVHARLHASTSQRVVATGLILTLYVVLLVSPLIPIDIIGFFTLLGSFRLGESVLSISGFVLLVIFLFLGSVYFLFNGYGYLLDKFEHLEEHLDEPVHKIMDPAQPAEPVQP